MLSADSTAERLAQAEDLCDPLWYVLLPCFIAKISFYNIHVQVAVTRVTITHRREAILFTDLLHTFKQPGKFGPWHHRVFLLVNTVAFYCLTNFSSNLPERVLLFRTFGEQDLITMVVLHHRGYHFAVTHE